MVGEVNDVPDRRRAQQLAHHAAVSAFGGSMPPVIEAVGHHHISSRNDACEAPLYHQTASIQPHGLFLAADPVSLRIVRISSNAASILGVPNDSLLAATLPDLLTPASAAHVKDLVRRLANGTESRPRHALLLDLTGPGWFSAAAFLYRSDALICIEIEPPETGADPDITAGLAVRYCDMFDSVARSDVRSDDLAGLVCDAIQKITGFDRIYFCRFDRIGHGHVLSETNNGVLSSLIDHHFPATDIPQAARRIMTVNRYRLIADVEATDVPIIGGDGAPLDLTFSACRAIAGSHLQYLRNMNVAASLSFSVVAEGQLKALFGGHHHDPRRVSSCQMAACWHLTELCSARFDSLRLQEDRVVLEQRTDALYDLAARFLQADCDLGSFIAARHDAFCELMDADDVLCRLDQRDHLGRLLPVRDASRLLDFLAQKTTGEARVFHSDCLLAENPVLALLCPAVAGALAVSLDPSGNNVIAWLRRETVVDQTWSGDPHQAIQVDERGAVGPRSSFLAYTRETRGTCAIWPSTTSDLACNLRQTFIEALARYYETGMRKAAEQANQLKSEFISNVTHELRSPMHAIIGFSQILAEDDASLPQAKRARFLETIIQSSRRLLHLIDDLLDLSRLEAGKAALDLRTGDILPTIERAVAGVESLARLKEIEIAVQRNCRSCSANFMPAAIEQVIVNLLSNAIRFSPPQSRIFVAITTTDVPPALIVQVSDQGVGIPAAELNMIFEKFVQSSRTRSGAGGTGLGLAICREIIDAHHGRIWAAKNAAAGASLFFEIPRAPSPQTGEPS